MKGSIFSPTLYLGKSRHREVIQIARSNSLDNIYQEEFRRIKWNDAYKALNVMPGT